MLPASPSNSSTTRTPAATSASARAASARTSTTNFGSWQIGLTVALMLYSFALGGALMGNLVRSERAYLLFAVPCLIPMAWCAYGYFKVEGQRDSGLALSGAGWLMLAMAFVFKHIAVVGAGADAYAAQASSPFVPIFGVFGILCLLAGAGFSWLFWAADEDQNATSQSQHY